MSRSSPHFAEIEGPTATNVETPQRRRFEYEIDMSLRLVNGELVRPAKHRKELCYVMLQARRQSVYVESWTKYGARLRSSQTCKSGRKRVRFVWRRISALCKKVSQRSLLQHFM
jgi:hypothetical protein